jgi:phosphopantothenate-cysteine ligase
MRYDHQVVVANLLHNRNRFVSLVLKDADAPVEIAMTDGELASGDEIEEKIVDDLTRRHQSFIDSKST